MLQLHDVNTIKTEIIAMFNFVFICLFLIVYKTFVAVVGRGALTTRIRTIESVLL